MDGYFLAHPFVAKKRRRLEIEYLIAALEETTTRVIKLWTCILVNSIYKKLHYYVGRYSIVS